VQHHSFTLPPVGLSGVNELCLFLAGLEQRREIGEWHFGRHLDRARLKMMVAFIDDRDADVAGRAWNDRPPLASSSQK
jgi:hypothetical protein